MTNFQPAHLSDLARARRRLLSKLAVATAILVPAGTVLALSSPSGSPGPTPASSNKDNSTIKLNVNRHNSQELTPAKDNVGADSDPKTDQHSSNSVIQHTYISTSTNGHTSSTKAKVNGHKIHIPTSGTVHKVIKNDDGETTIDVSSSGTGVTSNGSSLNVNISSNSTSVN